MKILLSAYACEPNRGSEPGVGWNTALHLAELGHEVWVLTCLGGKDAIESRLASAPVPNLHFVIFDAPSWIDQIIKGQLRYYIHYLGWQQRAYPIAKRLDLEQNFDIIHHVTFSSLQGGSWLWLIGKPFIFGPVGGGQIAPRAFKKYFMGYWRNERLRSILNVKFTIFNPITRLTISHADIVLFSNTETFFLAKQLSLKRGELVLDSALSSDYCHFVHRTRSKNSILNILWVGNIYARKGLPLGLDALTKVSRQLKVILTVVGGGPLEGHIPGWIAKFGLQDRVNYLGPISWIELTKIYQKSHLFLFTSLRDAFGVQLLEAMAHSLPIITLDHHGARDHIPDNAAVKVPVTTPEETVQGIAEAIEYLYRNPEKAHQMGLAGYAFAKKQTWGKRAVQLTDYYRQISDKGMNE